MEKNGFNEFFTIGEAATYLGVSPETLRNWDKSGKLIAYRHPINDYRLYLRKDLDCLLMEIVKSDKQRKSKRSKIYQ